MKTLLRLAITVLVVVIAISIIIGSGYNAIRAAVDMQWWIMLRFCLYVGGAYLGMNIILNKLWKGR